MAMSPPKVCVILATYNGERYLLEQLRSLSGQTREPDCVLLRDDGSSDQSVEIARSWSRESGVALQVERGPRLLPALSFLNALKVAGPADLYLFCDQDDVWLPHRIERALGFVPCGDDAPPVLYASRAVVVDSRLRFIGLTPTPQRLSFASAACESLLTGCTMAFNRPLREQVVRELPAFLGMHDWWLYLVASATATILFDETPTLLYRQHAHNVLGAAPSGWTDFGARLRRIISGDKAVRWVQLSELVRIHGAAMTPAAAALTKTLLSARSTFSARVRAAWCAPIVRQSRSRSLSTRLAILLNRF